MDNKTFGIGILSLMALVLTIAHFLPLETAQADAIKDRDYTLVTAQLASGGAGLYITDSRTNMCAVFTWDTSRRTIVLRDVRTITDAFQ